MSNPTHTFNIGAFECTIIHDGMNRAPMGRIFSGIPAAERDAALVQAGFDAATIDLNYHIMLVQTGAETVLIDTGVGYEAVPGAGKLRESLAGLGVQPADIDVIVITHAHPDHIGGLTFMEDTLAFPKARYYMARTEWEFWASEEALAAMAEEQRAHYLKTLVPIADKVALFKGAEEIVPGITAIPSPGHTIGHLALVLKSEDEELVHLADAAHHPIQLSHPDWSPVFDWDGSMSALTRRGLFSRAVRDEALVAAYHFPFPALGRIRAAGDVFGWEPVGIS